MTPPDQEWVRLHPLSPLLRGARFGVLLVLVLGQQGVRQQDPLAALAVVAVAVPVVAAFGYVSWRVLRYRLTPTELQVESGVLTRRSRRVPLARLQSVDVVRPLFARLLGLAELRLEVAGGGDTEAPLQYLSEDDAHRLRARLLDLAAGRAESEPAAGSAGPPERVLVAVPTAPLVWSTLLGAPAVAAVAVLVALAVTAAVDLRALGAVLLAAAPAVFAVVAAAARRLLTEYGFTVAESLDGLRLRHGLLETRSATIPLDRVQLVRVRRPLLWRRFGWVRVEIDVAGYAAGGGEELSTSALLPVAPAGLGDALVARVLGAPLPVPDRPAPRRARLRAPLQHARLRVGVDDRHLVSSYGVLTTTTDVVPLGKVQSLRLTDGPWQRRLALASLHVDTAGRRLPGTVLRHRDAAEARGLLAEVSVRARAARTRR